MDLKILKPLPGFLVKRYKGWKATTFQENKSLYKKLAKEGQNPKAMIISCCDSRVHVTSIFGSEAGEFFIHRNIANLVPPYRSSSDYHGTSAAIEYAVTILNVSHLIVLGHSSCGGVNACFNYFSKKNDLSRKGDSFIKSWLEILRSSYNILDKNSRTVFFSNKVIAPVAQWIRRRPPEAEIAGSSPARSMYVVFYVAFRFRKRQNN